MEKFILATSSERRIELFKKICNDFKVVKSEFEEDKIKEKDPVRFAVEAAVGKVKDVGEKYPEHIIVGGDTVVFLNNKIIGKPKDYLEAKKILLSLSGKVHSVITGIAVYRKKDERLLTGYEISYVRFKNLSEEEIENYLKEEDYLDKAGAYGIQNVGDRFVEAVLGDYENIVGMPMGKLKELIKKFTAEECYIKIEDIALPEGFGVGKRNNSVVFVPYAVEGDTLKVRILKKKKDFYLGEIVKIEEGSCWRVKPECKNFGVCGGCVLQNLLYERQIEIKKNWLIQCLRKFGEIREDEIVLDEICPSCDIYFYRNKMEFAFGMKYGRICVGLRERFFPFSKTYRKNIVPLEECAIFSKSSKIIFQKTEEYVNSTSFLPYDPFTRSGFLRHLVVRESKTNSDIMIILSTKTNPEFDFKKFVDALTSIDKVKSIYWVENDTVSDVVNYTRKHHIYGSPYILEFIEDLKFKIYPDTFFQTNTQSAKILYQKILENMEGGSRILGLYCGSGAIEIFLSKKAGEVVGVDCEEQNIEVAQENCRINNIKNCIFYRERVENIGEELKRKNFTHLIVDPPRGGISKKALKKICKLNIPNLVYISCNPSTFARDLKLLKESGYFLIKLYCFDFFPHTGHLETMGVFKKTL